MGRSVEEELKGYKVIDPSLINVIIIHMKEKTLLNETVIVCSIVNRTG